MVSVMNVLQDFERIQNPAPVPESRTSFVGIEEVAMQVYEHVHNFVNRYLNFFGGSEHVRERKDPGIVPRNLSIMEHLEEIWLFAKNCVREVLNGNYEIGAMGPTCGAVQRAIFTHFPKNIERGVGIGSGTGPFERAFSASSNTRLFSKLKRWDALEPAPELANFFERTVKDPRVTLHRNFSWDLPKIVPAESADMVLSTVPRLNDADQIAFSRMAFDCVRPGGRYGHGIFIEMPELIAEATRIPRRRIQVISIPGQMLPPYPYAFHIVDKPEGTHPVYSVPQ